MTTIIRYCLCIILFASFVSAARAAEPPKSTCVEVCFVLDTTGSMGGLIDGAKRKIWSIANSIVSAQKGGGNVRFALLAYRDRGDEYVTKVFDLTDDIDKIFAELQTFQAGGGGDGPESVNEALAHAVNKVAWSTSADVRKIIFLVGDAPPHTDYPQDVQFADTCQLAVKRGLIINTVQCGSDAATREVWQRIAKLSEGSFVALEQSGNMVTLETPVDKDIAALSEKIAATSVPYGSAEQQAQVAAKNDINATVAAPVAADRAIYNSREGKAIQGRGDLVSDVRENVVKLDDLDAKDLPKEYQTMTREELAAALQKRGAEREALSQQVIELSRKRQAYIDDQAKKQGAGGGGDSFDKKVAEIIEADLKRETKETKESK